MHPIQLLKRQATPKGDASTPAQDIAARRRLRHSTWIWVALAPLLCLCLGVLHGTHNDTALLYPESYSDHFSHHQATVLFMLRGLGVYRPILETCNKPDDLAMHQPPITTPRAALRDVCYLRERPDKDPLKINWSQFPRPYPLGLFIYTLPEAMLFNSGLADFPTVNRLSITKYLLGTFVLLWALALLFFVAPPAVLPDFAAKGKLQPAKKSRQHAKAAPQPRVGFWQQVPRGWLYVRRQPLRLAGLVLWPLLACEALKWAFNGFYDGLAVAFAVLGCLSAARRHWCNGMLLLSLAISLHLRMLWYLPVLAYCGIGWLRERWQAGKPWATAVPRHEWVKLLVSAVLLLSSAWVMVQVAPYLKLFPHTNWMHSVELSDIVLLCFWTPVVSLIFWHTLRRDFLQATTYAWITFVLYQTQQFQWWHTLSILPVWALAYLQGGRWRHVVSATIFAYCTVTYAFFYRVSFDWLQTAWVHLRR